MQSDSMSASSAWAVRVNHLAEMFRKEEGIVAPRGQRTAELLQPTMSVDLDHPVVICPSRNLSSSFMAAEARWVLSGDDTLEPLQEHAPQIGKFADLDPEIKANNKVAVRQDVGLQGTRFFGAYGPRFVRQLPYVVRCLGKDPASRQAVVSLWQESPPPTGDVPCTLSLTFMIRDNRLNCHVTMRSSDAWLGVPYDVFTFSAMAYRVGAELEQLYGVTTWPGTLFLTAASSHLYERNLDAARRIIQGNDVRVCDPVTRNNGTMYSGFTTLMRAIRWQLDGSGVDPDWKIGG